MSCFQRSAFQNNAYQGDGTPVVPPAAPEAPSRGVRSHRRYRVIEDPDRLQEAINREEKKVEQEKKELRILIKRSTAPNVEGELYQHFQAKIEKLEARIDDRLEKLAVWLTELQAAIDDEEEEIEELHLFS